MVAEGDGEDIALLNKNKLFRDHEEEWIAYSVLCFIARPFPSNIYAFTWFVSSERQMNLLLFVHPSLQIYSYLGNVPPQKKTYNSQ